MYHKNVKLCAFAQYNCYHKYYSYYININNYCVGTYLKIRIIVRYYEKLVFTHFENIIMAPRWDRWTVIATVVRELKDLANWQN